MGQRIGGEARAAVMRAQEQARRFGQQFIGCEHLLYGVAGAGDVAGRVLRARGVTPERIEEQVALLTRHGSSAGVPAELDGGALSAIGIDLDAVRGRVEEAFGTGALDRAAGGPRRARGGHLRMTRQARRCIIRAMREHEANPAGAHGSEHIALAVLAADASVPRHVLANLGVSAPQLSAEIRETL